MKPKRDLTKIIGDKYQRFTILEAWYAERGEIKVKAICECGVIKTNSLRALVTKRVHSCGCKKIENLKNTPPRLKHGLTDHPIFILYSGMVSRCYHPKDISYHNYGAVGVEVCQEWKDDKMAFYNWAIANGWEKGLQLDKDKLAPNNRGKMYSPEFCCFLTRKENMQYKRNCVMITHNGKTQNVSQWAQELGIPAKALFLRLSRGWSEKETIETPLRKRNNIAA